uniref:Uncharacterized protein n=1 Tax=Ciona intestinalis TaxID=7719 RepID=H2Y1P6_CIOIN
MGMGFKPELANTHKILWNLLNKRRHHPPSQLGPKHQISWSATVQSLALIKPAMNESPNQTTS